VALQLTPTGFLLAEDVDELSLTGTLQTLELGGVGAMRIQLDQLFDLLVGKTMARGLIAGMWSALIRKKRKKVGKKT